MWTLVIPVKHTDHGKSRLAVPGLRRTELARAIALDTIAAAVDAARVIVATSDHTVAREARALGAAIAADAGGGIDAAIAAVMPATGFRASLLGDLPALRAEDLADALKDAASLPRAVVPDAEGTGSTLVTATPGQPWASAFGHDSFARHVALGCVPLDVAETSSLRRDVDTLAQLEAAAAMGLGPRTAAVFATRLQTASA